MTAAILGDPVRPGGCMGPVTWPSSAGACRMRSHSWSAATAAARSWPASSLRYRGSIRGACVGSLERSVMEPVLCGFSRMAAMVMPGASGLPSPSSTNGPGTKSSSMSGSSRLVLLRTKPKASAIFEVSIPLTSNIAEAFGFVRSNTSLELPDIELLFVPGPFVDEGLGKPEAPGITIAAILLQPHSTGSITLRSSDPTQAPRIDPRYLSDEAGHDRAAAVAALH